MNPTATRLIKITAFVMCVRQRSLCGPRRRPGGRLRSCEGQRIDKH